MKKVRPLLLILIGTMLLLSACGVRERLRSFLQGGPDNAAVVRLGEVVYTRSELERFFDSRLSEFRDPGNTDSVKSSLLESFVEEKLLLQEADNRNVQPDQAALKAMMEKIATPGADGQGADRSRSADLERAIAESLKTQQYLHDYLLKDVDATEAECDAYYNQHLSEFVRKDVVHVREILVDDLALAERILGLLKANRNRNFGELARLYSKAATAADGGDMGQFERGDLPEEFERVIFSLTPGNVSRIVRTQYGYHTFLLDEKIAAHQEKFYEVRDRIRERLVLERQREVIEREIASLQERIAVEIYRDRLGFNYVGTKFAMHVENN